MKKLIIYLLLVTFLTSSTSTHIYNNLYSEVNYDSYYNNRFKNPILVTYILHKGGGDVSRTGMRFIGNPYTATDHDYAGGGYDRGHLCNAEDFAYSKDLEEATFRYYNCIPQTPNLNRGCWKVLETKVREESQKEELFIACGGFFSIDCKRIGINLYVPDTCFKVVKSLRTGKILHSMIFLNKMENAVGLNYSSKKIEKRIGINFLDE